MGQIISVNYEDVGGGVSAPITPTAGASMTYTNGDSKTGMSAIVRGSFVTTGAINQNAVLLSDLPIPKAETVFSNGIVLSGGGASREVTVKTDGKAYLTGAQIVSGNTWNVNLIYDI